MDQIEPQLWPNILDNIAATFREVHQQTTIVWKLSARNKARNDYNKPHKLVRCVLKWGELHALVPFYQPLKLVQLHLWKKSFSESGNTFSFNTEAFMLLHKTIGHSLNFQHTHSFASWSDQTCTSLTWGKAHSLFLFGIIFYKPQQFVFAISNNHRKWTPKKNTSSHNTLWTTSTSSPNLSNFFYLYQDLSNECAQVIIGHPDCNIHFCLNHDQCRDYLCRGSTDFSKSANSNFLQSKVVDDLDGHSDNLYSLLHINGEKKKQLIATHTSCNAKEESFFEKSFSKKC